MLNVQNCNQSVSFGHGVPREGIYNIGRAMEIAHNNPKSYSILHRRGITHIVREAHGNVRIVSYGNNGDVLEVLHRPNVNSGIVFKDGNGIYNILDYERNNGNFYMLKFKNLRSFISFFKNETPVLKPRKPDGTY